MGFLEWFRPSNKYNKWFIILLIGFLLISYSIAQIITLNVVEPLEVLWIIIEFVVGASILIFGVIGIQKRTLEIYVEANGNKINDKKLNLNSLIFDKTIYDNGPKIVLIGGGAGTNEVTKGLKAYTNNITVLVPLSENVKDKEMLSSKNRLNILPYSNIKENIAVLSDDENLMRRLLTHDFTSKQLEGLNFGDIYLVAMQELFTNLSTSIKKSTEVLNIKGEVVPISLDQITVKAELTDGTIIENKEDIPKITVQKTEAIQRVSISPTSVRPSPRALEAISEADAIIIGPGNLYTDIIPTLLVKEVMSSIKESKAKKIYIANIMTDKGQTDRYKLSEHLKAIIDHTRENVFDYCIADTGEITPEYLRMHHKEGTDVVEIDKPEVKKMGTKVIERDLSKIIDGKIRHDSETIALTIMELVLSEVKYSEEVEKVQKALLESVLREQKKKAKKKEKKLKKAIKKGAKVEEEAIEEVIKKKKSKFSEKYNERIQVIKEVDKKKDEKGMLKNFFNKNKKPKIKIEENKKEVEKLKEQKLEENIINKVYNKQKQDENKFNTISIHKLIEQKTAKIPIITEQELNTYLSREEIEKEAEKKKRAKAEAELEEKRRMLEELRKKREAELLKELEEKKAMEPKRRGRPKKSEVKEVEELEEAPKRRGRPPKRSDKETAKILLEELRKLEDARNKLKED